MIPTITVVWVEGLLPFLSGRRINPEIGWVRLSEYSKGFKIISRFF